MNIRFGRALPLLFAGSAQLLALAMLYGEFTYMVFVGAAALFSLGWYLYVPYQFGLLAALDRDGRPMVLLNAVAGLGSGVGPAIVAVLLTDGFAPVFQITALFLALSVVFLLGAMFLGRGLTAAS